MLFGRRFVCFLFWFFFLFFALCPALLFVVVSVVSASFHVLSCCFPSWYVFLFPRVLFVMLCLLYWLLTRFGHSSCMLTWCDPTHLPLYLLFPFCLLLLLLVSCLRSLSWSALATSRFCFLLSACCAVCLCRGGVFSRGGYVVSAGSMSSLSAFCFVAERCFRPCNAWCSLLWCSVLLLLVR